jgi:hypothetical protein
MPEVSSAFKPSGRRISDAHGDRVQLIEPAAEDASTSLNTSIGMVPRPKGPPVYLAFPVYPETPDAGGRSRTLADVNVCWNAELRVFCPIGERARTKRNAGERKWTESNSSYLIEIKTFFG